jgi:hypothetical protein
MYGIASYFRHKTFLEFTYSERHSVDLFLAESIINEAGINI